MSTAEKLSDGASASGESDPLLGKVLNQKFKIHSLLATGGMGVIYRGEQIALERQVAIKVLTPTNSSNQIDPNFHKRFFLEASILARLQHPNIVTVFDYGRVENMEPERYFMAMEFLEGETLFRRLRKAGRLSAPDAMGVARQIARGLREAHKHGVVHRDLKPSNVMLVPGEDTGELVKILDFGLVKVLADDSEELTQQGSFLGSPRFMSPEQISHGKVDLRTDVYSLGVIVYQMLCGKVPFEAQNSVQILIAHLQQPVPRMRERNPEADVPEPLEAFVLRCLSKDPEGRPANMEAFIRGLGECAQAMGLSPAFGSTGLVTMDSTGTGRMPTPMPPVRVMTAIPASPSPPSSSGGAASPVDDASLGAASRPADAAPQGRKGIVLVAVGVLAVAGIGVAMSQMRPSEPPPVPAQPEKPQVAPAPPPADVGTFVLMVESMPSGAEVLEDGKPLGTTPLQLSISNSSVRANPRRLTVRQEGYEPYSIVQGPSDQSVRLVATLTKRAAAPTSSPAAPTPPPPAAPAPRPYSGRPAARPTPAPDAPPPAAPSPRPLDIQIER
ncbi:serine/threonine-protein kinase [Sorangium sp. Soce836]|uniref:serine/threonine-protein kinase n=1 Tax=Sorangium sp. So ce836 TaxID=2969250 RepID=UPI00234FBC59|nr:serine/threonine-protein kinase [Sorangium sp. Soce836]WCQ97696.1 serine-threonine kinase [Sorangium sp. Soce836]